ncbi:MAG: sigma-70 family RNA polymerase sigma factor [Armatimonadetes bacterium]|nr:sigma-70 family RNA polymerase sigma factor [Armatimonadota bacterium]
MATQTTSKPTSQPDPPLISPPTTSTGQTAPSPARMEDTALVLRALVGDLAAFDELVRRYRGAVLAVAQGVTGSFDRAQDVTQDAFLLAFRKLAQLDDPARFSSWLYAITRHRAQRFSRRESRSEPTDADILDTYLLEQSHEIAPNPLDEIIRQVEHLSVRGAFGKLPEEHQIILRLYYYEEWPVKRIAEFLSLPTTTVKWRLHEGRQRLKRSLSGALEVQEDE